MNEASSKRSAYYREAATWAADRDRARSTSHRLAWAIAGVASSVALFEAIALVALAPLKTVVPYTLLVDRQTGFVQELKPLDRQLVAPDAALTRSLLAQYVIAREGFDIGTLQDDYRKVALWSAGEARTQYVADMRASSPASPLARLPRQTLLQVEVRSISSLSKDTALVRFVTTRQDAGGRPSAPSPWVAIVTYRFSSGRMTEADRFTNPLGFQVVRYRRNAEVQISLPPAAAPTTIDALRAPPSNQKPAVNSTSTSQSQP